MNISQEGKRFIAEVEGISPDTYIDSGGEPTIGVGHLLTHSERASGKIKIAGHMVVYRDGLTNDECLELLDQDLDIAEKAVNENVVVLLTQCQFDALVSFVFNVGVGAFETSTLLRCLNQGDYGAVPEQLPRWKYDNGMVVQGLVNRRQKEVDLWNGPVTVLV